jgi:hypothetical protein
MSKQSLFVLCAVLVGLCSATTTLAQHAHEDIIIGQDGSGMLMAEFDEWAPEDHELDPVSGFGLDGFLGDDPGFEALEADEPDEGFFVLGPGHAIYFEIVSVTPGFLADPLTDPLDSPGDSALLVDDAEDHAHLDWFIDSTHPDFASTPYWDVAFRFTDRGAIGYGDSEVYTLRFVPEPASLGLLCAGSLLVLLRRR